MLDSRRAALWSAMQLGPQWVLRARAPYASHEVPPPAAAAAAGVDGIVVRMPPPADDRARAIAALDWGPLAAAVRTCTACGLCRGRTQTVFGVGQPDAPWLLVGEAPGAEEDASGEPFVGQAGRLLDNMLAAVGLSRSGAGDNAVFIANVLKCRPPGNRNPDSAEVALCDPFLKRQVALIGPRIIVVMGRFAAQSLLQTDATIASLRGKVHALEAFGGQIPVVVTYHPAYLLRNLADKSKSWADLCLAKQAFAQQPRT